MRSILEQEEPDARPSVSALYERIHSSNSHLARQKKAALIPSIERIFDQIDRDEGDSDDLGSIDGEFDGIEIEPKSASAMNRQIVAGWKTEPVKETETTYKAAAVGNRIQKRATNSEPPAKKRKVTAEVDRSAPTHVSLADLGGVDDVIEQLEELVVFPLIDPGIYTSSYLQPPRGILLHGPPGCGKTMIANAVAAEFGVPFISISAPSIVSGMSGESEKALREYFEEARKMAPCMIFIDEIDAITPKRESAQREMEKRIVAQLLTCMDDLSLEKTGGKAIIVLAATNRPDSIDPALRRGGRFDKEINMSVPSQAVREQILKALTRKMNMEDELDFKKLAKSTAGFVGADLNDLVSTSGAVAIKRHLRTMKSEAATAKMDIDSEQPPVSAKVSEFRQLINCVRDQKARREATSSEYALIKVAYTDFEDALKRVQPSAQREGFATVPSTTWNDIGALSIVRERLKETIVDPIMYPEGYERVGLTSPNGVLLWGPPGCGKTLLAKAVANESHANFISIKGPELLNKYVGESERAVRQVFSRARSSVPCVIFIDEMDALVPKRDDALSESSARVVNTLLTELDGMSSREGIYVIGATNRPDVIDPAMLRPGRLSYPLFVDIPQENERVEILNTLTKGISLQGSDGLNSIARSCTDFSGADLGNLVDQAKMEAIRRDSGRSGVMLEDFTMAKKKIGPSVKDRAVYTRLNEKWSSKR